VERDASLFELLLHSLDLVLSVGELALIVGDLGLGGPQVGGELVNLALLGSHLLVGVSAANEGERHRSHARPNQGFSHLVSSPLIARGGLAVPREGPQWRRGSRRSVAPASSAKTVSTYDDARQRPLASKRA